MFDRVVGRWNGSQELRCIACGDAIAPVLAELGSTTCHACRDGAVPVAESGPARPIAASSAPAGLQELHRELYRSRRYDRPLALIGVPHPANGEPAALSALVRSIDRVWAENGRVYLLLPEANRAMGEALLARLEQHRELGVRQEDARLAVFPEDGLTTGALLEAVQAPGAEAAGGNGRPRLVEAGAVKSPQLD